MKNTLKTIVIDDEPKAIEVIKRYAQDSDVISVQESFRDPIKAIEYLQNNSIDLIFLDINMPKLNGIEFLNILDNKPKVIFTTAYSEYAVESYDYDTVDYLIKPIDFKRFLKAVTKAKNLIYTEVKNNAISQHIETDHTIFIKSGPQLHKIKVDDILFLEKEGNYLTFHTIDKKILSRQNMKDIFDLLDPKEFMRIHKSFVVALKHIEIIEVHQVKIRANKIPIGRNYREELMKTVSQD